MPRKNHLIVNSGCTQDNERWVLSACGLNVDSDVAWDGTHQRDFVSCKRCQAKMAKPRPAPEPFHKERPILFNGAMVRAILSGQKTVTRRPVRAGFNPEDLEGTLNSAECRRLNRELPVSFGPAYFCPSGQPGDRLWVRETFALLGNEDGVCVDWQERLQKGDEREAARIYRASCSLAEYGLWQIPEKADWKPDTEEMFYEGAWRPSIHMPRWASRILLEITAVRVERLQDISEDQALAEGIGAQAIESFRAAGVDRPASFAFRDLWTSINGDENWTVNPWVWVVEFKRVAP